MLMMMKKTRKAITKKKAQAEEVASSVVDISPEVATAVNLTKTEKKVVTEIEIEGERRWSLKPKMMRNINKTLKRSKRVPEPTRKRT